MDFITTAKRSRNMRAIKSSSNTTTEMRFRALLIRNRVAGWRVRPKNVLGCPDFYFSSRLVAVFVDGCFWHCCPKCGHTPKANRRYWTKKLEQNKQRDICINKLLRSQGIKLVRIWECELRAAPQSCLKRLLRTLDTVASPRKLHRIPDVLAAKFPRR
jgi:DNA mismatch endonuclease (patch repair protein)